MQLPETYNFAAEQRLWKIRLLRHALWIALVSSSLMMALWLKRGNGFDAAMLASAAVTIANLIILHPHFGWRSKGAVLIAQLSVIGLWFPLYIGVRYSALSIAGGAVMIAATFFGRLTAFILLGFHISVLLAYGYLAETGVIHPPTMPLSGDSVFITWLKAIIVYTAIGSMLTLLVSGIVDSLEAAVERLNALSGKNSADQQYIRQLIDFAPEAIVVFDLETGRFIDVNPQAEKLFGYPAAELLRLGPNDVSPPQQENGRNTSEMVREYLDQALSGQTPVFEWVHQNSSGDPVPCEIRLHRMPGESGHKIRGSITDIRERRKAQAIIQSLALYDNLTGLPNRKLFNDRLRQTIAASERDQQYGALYFIDVDNFKNINDTSGHASGDYYLTVVAERISACVSEGDTVARWGGDEFVVVVENLTASLSEAARRAEKIGEQMLVSLAEPCENPYARGQYFDNTVSIGLTLLYGHIHSADELLKRADIAMYQAKMAGKNQLRNFDVKMQREIEAKMALENDLRRALGQNQLLLHYQPQFDGMRKPFGAEVLLRWLHPERGMVHPGDFISVAEETGDIVPIGRWIITTACEKLKQWQGQPATAHFVMAINVSPRQFRDPGFVAHVTEAVRSTGVNPAGLKLELTEGLMLDNIEETITKMEALKKIGVSFCLDDFGTGYSSLSYLKRLPLSQLKIDQSFVRDIAVDASDAVLIRTIIGMAANLNLQVLAEGVETEEQLQMLHEMGCMAYQGYLFSRPIGAAELDKMTAA